MARGIRAGRSILWPLRLPAPTSLMRREAQERVRRLGEIWTGPATEVTFAWAHMIGSMRARRSRERPRNEGGEGIGGGLGPPYPLTIRNIMWVKGEPLDGGSDPQRKELRKY